MRPLDKGGPPTEETAGGRHPIVIAIEALMRALDDPAPVVSSSALISLIQIVTFLDPSQPYHWMLVLLRECERIAREENNRAARQHLLKSGKLREIRKALKTGNEGVRHSALYLLNFLPTSRVARQFLDVLQKDPCPVVRHEIPFLLVRSRIAGTREAIIHAMLFDESGLVRHEAAEALGSSRDPTVLPFLERALNDRDAIVCETARVAIEELRLAMRIKRE